MSETTRHLTWENFEKLISRGVPAVHRVVGSPDVLMFVDERGRRIGLRSPEVSADIAPSPVSAIDVGSVTVSGQRYVEVSTVEQRLFPEFYSFAVSLADRIQLKQQPALQALEGSLLNWNHLLQVVTLLPNDKQLGLAGELWTLARLIRHSGPDAINAWTGPLGEPHDFRIYTTELEVKATIGPTRSHMINGEDQLVASPGHELYILSIQVEPAGSGGRSLPEIAGGVAQLLESHPLQNETFTASLKRMGYEDKDRGLYVERLQLRNRPRLIRVDESCPQLTRPRIEALEPTNSYRISDLHYRVNLEGLGFEDGTPEFNSLLPPGGDSDSTL